MSRSAELTSLVATLRAAGCVAAEEEAEEFVAAVRGDRLRLAELVARRVRGEPLAWLTGSVQFCRQTVLVDSGVYVPRWQSEPLARRAAALLPDRGVAVDLCTGAGSVAAVLMTARPDATVLATDLDPRAVACARRNGVLVLEGDLFAPLPLGIRGRVDVLTAIAPYVPHDALDRLPRDVVDFEPAVALDGGTDGLDAVRRIVAESVVWVRSGGSALLEVGGEQCDEVVALLERAGYVAPAVIEDLDGDLRGVCAQRA